MGRRERRGLGALVPLPRAVEPDGVAGRVPLRAPERRAGVGPIGRGSTGRVRGLSPDTSRADGAKCKKSATTSAQPSATDGGESSTQDRGGVEARGRRGYDRQRRAETGTRTQEDFAWCR